MNIQKIEKFNNVSLLRAISFVLIIVYHILMIINMGNGDGTLYFPFYFAVQIFLFLSGFLYSNKKITNVKDFYKRNIIKIGIPTLFLILVEIILCLLINPQIANPANWLGYYQTGIFALGHLWYIYSIIICYLLLPIIQKIFDINFKYRNLFKTILVLVCIIEFIYCHMVNSQVVFLVFIAGFLFGKNKKKSEKLNNLREGELALSSVIVFCVAEVIYLFARYFWANDNSILSNLLLGTQHYMASLLAISFTIFFLYCFKFMNNHRTNPILKFCDKYSFYIYLYHHIFIVGTCSLLYLTPYLSLNILAILLATVSFSMAMEYLSTKSINYLNNFKFKKHTEKQNLDKQ